MQTEALIKKQREFFRSGKTLDVRYRIQALDRLEQAAIQYEENINLEELKEHIKKRDELQKQAGFYKIQEKTKQIDCHEN